MARQDLGWRGAFWFLWLLWDGMVSILVYLSGGMEYPPLFRGPSRWPCWLSYFIPFIARVQDIAAVDGFEGSAHVPCWRVRVCERGSCFLAFYCSNWNKSLSGLAWTWCASTSLVGAPANEITPKILPLSVTAPCISGFPDGCHIISSSKHTSPNDENICCLLPVQ